MSRTKAEKALWTKYCTRPIPKLEEVYTGMGYKKAPPFFTEKTLSV